MRIYVRAMVYRYEPQRTMIVTTDRALAFAPLAEIDPKVRMYRDRPDFFKDAERVDVWENNQRIETWTRESGVWEIPEDD